MILREGSRKVRSFCTMCSPCDLETIAAYTRDSSVVSMIYKLSNGLLLSLFIIHLRLLFHKTAKYDILMSFLLWDFLRLSNFHIMFLACRRENQKQLPVVKIFLRHLVWLQILGNLAYVIHWRKDCGQRLPSCKKKANRSLGWLRELGITPTFKWRLEELSAAHSILQRYLKIHDQSAYVFWRSLVEYGASRFELLLTFHYTLYSLPFPGHDYRYSSYLTSYALTTFKILHQAFMNELAYADWFTS